MNIKIVKSILYTGSYVKSIVKCTFGILDPEKKKYVYLYHMRALYSVVILAVLFSILFLINHYIKSSEPVTLISDSTKPDIFLLNSKLYLVENSPDRGYSNLQNAINLIETMRSEYDEESQVHIDLAMEGLREISSDLENKKVYMHDLNEAYVLALNALTYAQIREAEIYVQKGEMGKAKEALKYAMAHIQNALKFSEGSKKEYEIQIYSEMNSIIEDESLTKEEIFRLLENMLDELEDLEVAYE